MVDFRPIASTPDTSDTSKVRFRPLTSPSFEQKAGSVPTKEGLKSLIPTKEELPEIIGATIGGIAGGIPGAALGGAAGSAFKQLGQRANLLKGKPPETALESMGESAMGAVRGGISEVGGKIIGKMFSPFAKSITPEIVAQKAAAESVGIVPPLSTLSESKTVQALERFGEVSPFGGMITRQKKKALDQFQGFAKSIGDKIAPDRPAEVTGNMARQSLETFKEAYDATKDKLYDAVLPKLKDQPVNLENTINTLQDVIKRRSGTAEPAGINQVKEWLDDLMGKKVKSNLLDKAGKPYEKGLSSTVKNFEELRRFRTNIGQRGKFNDPAMSGLTADMSDIYSAISRDLDNAASSADTGIAEGLKKADEFFRQGKSTLKSKVFKAIGTVHPENVHKVVIVPNSPSQIQIGKEIMGADTFKDVERQWLDSLLRNSTITREGDTFISPAKLSANLKKYGSTVDELFKDRPELSQQFSKLRDVSALMSRGKGITEGSQTAYLAQLLAPVMTAFYSPQAALGVMGFLGLQGIGTKALTTNVGRKLLTSGFPKVGKAATRLIQPAAQLGLQRKTIGIQDILNSEDQ